MPSTLAPSRAPYSELRVRIPLRAAEAVANFLMERGAAGLVHGAPAGARGAVLAAPFASRARAQDAARALRRYLAGLCSMGILRGSAPVAVRTRQGSDWAERWKAFARPVCIGWRLVIRPSWMRGPAPAGTATVTMDPGMAFGTGAHPTTRLCLEGLARHLTGGERVLDVGSGSGSLAIAAAKLGAREALALDTDPVACRIARSNARANSVGWRVRVCAAVLAGSAGRGFEVAVTNLAARDVAPLLPALARRVRPGGLVVLSGILRSQGGPVRRAARAAGLAPVVTRRRGEWIALEAVRPPRDA